MRRLRRHKWGHRSSAAPPRRRHGSQKVLGATWSRICTISHDVSHVDTILDACMHVRCSFVHVYICTRTPVPVHSYMCTCVHVNMFTREHVYTCARVHVLMYTCVPVCQCTCAQVYMCTCVQVRMCTRALTCACVYVICVCVCVCVRWGRQWAALVKERMKLAVMASWTPDFSAACFDLAQHSTSWDTSWRNRCTHWYVSCTPPCISFMARQGLVTRGTKYHDDCAGVLTSDKCVQTDSECAFLRWDRRVASELAPKRDVAIYVDRNGA